MKKTVLLLLVVCTVLCPLLSCGETVTSTLSAPTQLRVDEAKGLLHWSYVEGAVNYIVTVNGVEQIPVTVNYMDLKTLELLDGQSVTVRVKASGDGYIKLGSPYSQELTFVYREPTVQGTPSPDVGGDVDSYSKDTISPLRYVTYPTPATLVDKCTDKVYNYYLYSIGSIERVPTMYTAAQYHDGTIAKTYTMSVSKFSSSAFSTSLSNSITKTHSNHLGVTLGMKFGSNSAPVSGHFNIESGWENSTASTWSTTVQTSQSVSQTIEEKQSFTLDATCPAGYYRYAFYAPKCDVYTMVAYHRESKEFSYEYLSYTVSDAEHPYLAVVEYSEDGTFPNSGENLEFDLSVLDEINLKETLENRGGMIYVRLPLANCNDGNNYDKSEPEADENWINVHKYFDTLYYDLGHLELFGCREKNGKYYVQDLQKFSLQYVFEQNTDDLPKKRENGKEHDAWINSDTATKVKDTTINTQVGKGAYWIRITYRDGTVQSAPIQATNFMAGKRVGDRSVLLTGNQIECSSPSGIAKIEVVIVYEIMTDIYYFLAGNQCTNWRCEYTFNFQ